MALGNENQAFSSATNSIRSNNIIEFPRNSAGWFAAPRAWLDHPIIGAGQTVKPANPKKSTYSRLEAWLWLYAKAQFQPVEKQNKGILIVLGRGQLMAAHGHLAETWNWSLKAVRWFLNKLAKVGMIHTLAPKHPGKRKGNLIQIITINNYDDFSSPHVLERQAEGHLVGDPRASWGQEFNKGTKEINTRIPPIPPQAGGAGTVLPSSDFSRPRDASRRVRRDRERSRKDSERYVVGSDGRQHFSVDSRHEAKVGALVITGVHADQILLDARASDDAAEPKHVQLALIAASEKFPIERSPAPTLKTVIEWCASESRRLATCERLGLDPSKRENKDVPKPNWWRGREDICRSYSEEYWSEMITHWARNAWSVEFLGPLPGTLECLVPDEIVKKLNLIERYGGA